MNIFNLKKVFNEVLARSDYINLRNEKLIELQNTLFHMYIDICKVCQEYGIQLVLIGGTALGAVRHKDFIPWDDDMDFALKRFDYNKLIQIFDSTSLVNDYILRGPGYHGGCTARFIKIYKKASFSITEVGVGDNSIDKAFVDIFPLDYAPSNLLIRYVRGIIANMFMLIYSLTSFYQNKNQNMKKFYFQTIKGKLNYVLRAILGGLLSFKSYKEWNVILNNYITCEKETPFVTMALGSKHYFGHLTRANIFFPYSEGHFRSKSDVLLPSKQHDYLSFAYGNNYMDIPPLDKRENHYYLKNSKK